MELDLILTRREEAVFRWQAITIITIQNKLVSRELSVRLRPQTVNNVQLIYYRIPE
jgi:hypothetical protein